jgi:hypothetical protein
MSLDVMLLLMVSFASVLGYLLGLLQPRRKTIYAVRNFESIRFDSEPLALTFSPSN